MAVLHIANISDETFALWKVGAAYSQQTFRQWVIEGLEDKARKRGLSGQKEANEDEMRPTANIPKKAEIKPTPEQEQRIILEAQEKLDERKKGEPIKGLVRAFTPEDRTVLAFKKAYNREPKTRQELEEFGKKGW